MRPLVEVGFYRDGTFFGVKITSGILQLLVFEYGNPFGVFVCSSVIGSKLDVCTTFSPEIGGFTIDELLDYLEKLDDYDLKVYEGGI